MHLLRRLKNAALRLSLVQCFPTETFEFVLNNIKCQRLNLGVHFCKFFKIFLFPVFASKVNSGLKPKVLNDKLVKSIEHDLFASNDLILNFIADGLRIEISRI